MRYQLFSDLDYNFGVHLMKDDGSDEMITEHPKTKAKMTRQEALELAEKICNPQLPKTKQEFFELFSDEDFEKYTEAKYAINNRYSLEISNEAGVTESTKKLKSILTKFELLPSFDLTEADLSSLKILCKEFEISAIGNF